MDPLAIASGIGQGEAQVFDRGLTTADALNYALNEKRRKEDKAEASEKVRQKAMKDIYDTVDEVNITGYLPHMNYLTKQKDQIRGYLTEQYTKSQGKYSPDVDPVIGKLVSNLKKENQMSTQIKEYAKQLPTMLTKENAKNYTDESILEVDNFLKLPLDQQAKYIEEKGSYPLPKPKPEVIDYDKSIDDIAKNLSEKSTTVEKVTPTGGTETITTSGYDPNNVNLYAKSYVVAGLEGRKPDAANLLQQTRKNLEKDIVFQAMSPEEQDKKIAMDAEKYVAKRIMAQEKKSYSQTRQGEAKGLTVNFVGGNTMENDKVRVVVKDTEEGKRIYNIAQIKGTENSELDFSLPDGKIIKGKPLRVEKNMKTGGVGVVISVPKTATQKIGSGKYAIQKQVPTGEFYEKMVPYTTNEERIFKGKLKFTTDEIDKGITEGGVQVKESGENKQGSYTNITKAKDAKGNSIQIGVKDGKWYNVSTGKLL